MNANYFKRSEEISSRLLAIADACEAEKREMTDAERAEVEVLDREKTSLSLRMKADDATVAAPSKNKNEAFGSFLREELGKSKIANIELRDAITTGTSGISNFIPLTINDIIEPLEEGLIYKMVGIKIMGGLQGSYVWPALSAFEASIASEGVAVSDGSLSLSNVQPTPKRVGVSFLVSMQTINQSVNKVFEVIKAQLPQAVARLLNRVIFTPSTVNASMVGPFVYCKAQTAKTLSELVTKELQKGCYNLTFAAALPTYKELLAMKGCVMSRGVENDGTAAYVMDEYTKAQLEATPRDTGSGRMIVENGAIAGIPVFCTNEINETAADHIGFGVWSNCALGQFGEQRLVVDTISEAAKDCARISLNGDWSVSVLRPQAFCLGTPDDGE